MNDRWFLSIRRTASLQAYKARTGRRRGQARARALVTYSEMVHGKCLKKILRSALREHLELQAEQQANR